MREIDRGKGRVSEREIDRGGGGGGGTGINRNKYIYSQVRNFNNLAVTMEWSLTLTFPISQFPTTCVNIQHTRFTLSSKINSAKKTRCTI